MAANVKVIHHSDFVRARPDGKADLAEGERLLAAIAWETPELKYPRGPLLEEPLGNLRVFNERLPPAIRAAGV